MQATQRAKFPATPSAAASPPASKAQKDPGKRVQFPFETKGDSPSNPGKLTKKTSHADIKEAKAAPSLPIVAKTQSLFSQSHSIAPPATDVTFIVQGIKTHAHRKILQRSECAAFFTPRLNQQAPIEIKELSVDAFQALIDYMYSDRLSIKPDTLFELYQFYRAQKFETLAKELEANLLKEVNWKNFSLLLRIARTTVPGTPLYENLLNIGLQHSAYLWTRLDQIPLELFLEILQHDQLNIPNEYFLLKVIRCWLLMQPVQDRQSGDKCYKHVRFGCLSESERLCMKEVEPLVSPGKWAEIQNKLNNSPKKQETFWRPRVAAPAPPRFVFTLQAIEERIKDSNDFYSHSFHLSRQASEQKVRIFHKGEMFFLTVRFNEDDNPQHYPFKLYLDNGSPSIDQKKVFLWLQTQVKPNNPALMVRTLRDLREGLPFSSRYLTTLKSHPDNWEIRFAAIIFL